MKTPCDQVRTALQRALDGAADGMDTQWHLEACAGCQAYAQALRGVGAVLAADAARPLPPIDLTARLGLVVPAPARRPRTRWQGVAAAATAVAAAVLVGVGQWATVPGPGGVKPSVQVAVNMAEPEDGALLLAFFGPDADDELEGP